MTTTTSRPPSTPASGRLTRHRTGLAAAATVTLWASSFVSVRALGSAYSPGALAFGRIAVGALVLAAVTVRPDRRWPRGRALAVTAAYGAAWFAAYTVAFNAAARHLDAGTLALVINVAPILVAVLAGAFLQEGFPRRLLIGMAIAFAGIAIISFSASGPSLPRAGTGLTLALLAAVLYAIGVLLQKVALRSTDPMMTTFLGCAAGALVLVPYAPQFAIETATAPGGAIATLLYLAVFPTAIAFSTWTYALARSDAGRLAATALTVPAIVIALSWLLLDELPTLAATLGGALCLLGVGISRRRPPPRPPTTGMNVGDDPRVVTDGPSAEEWTVPRRGSRPCTYCRSEPTPRPADNRPSLTEGTP